MIAGMADGRVVPADPFTARVAVRAAVDDVEARAATEAVLATLAERTGQAEVDELIRLLPPALHSALREAGPGSAPHLDRAGFLARIATRTGAPPEEAEEYARAVFATLREKAADREFFDVTVRLPADYRSLLIDA
jgi:uncharacterized protein (DUF2267 family)